MKRTSGQPSTANQLCIKDDMDDKNDNHFSKDSLEGKYANNFRVGYNAFEFLIDLGQVYEEDKTVCMHTRIITSPNYVKELLKTLIASVNGYEATFGKIEEQPDVT